MARYLEADNRIMLILGSTEQHAYLSLLTDALIPTHLADAAAKRASVLVAPPLNFGISPYFAAYPGTMTVRAETYTQLILELVAGLVQQGFRRIFILNGHGGNALPDLIEHLQAVPDCRLTWYDWWRSHAVKTFEQEYNLKLNHANWGENFPFNRVAASPTTEKPTIAIDTHRDDPQTVKAKLGDGSFGGQYQVDDTLMQTLFTMVVDEIVQLLDALRAK